MAEVINIFIILFVCFRSAASVNDRYYPRYHLAPLHGWMNDPNGFSFYKNMYHMFYQYNPETSENAGVANWGHAVSRNLFNWTHLPIALKPDESYDEHGAFSGSAIIENDTMYIFYTGNVNYADRIPDHRQVQAMAYTKDGINVTKFNGNPIINGTTFQPNFRDPKVWKHRNEFYMVLGNSIDNKTGQVLLYQSDNLVQWKYKSVLLRSNGSLGYMWECPNLFQLGKYYILLISPQGIQPQGDKFRNLYQTGYIIGDFDYTSGRFTPQSEFYEIDHGNDFYAAQTMLDKKGRRTLVAWMDMWEQIYPERKDGFTGQMTIPRELLMNSKGQIIQKPVEEVNDILGEVLYSGTAQKCLNITLPNKTAKITIHASKRANISLFVYDASNSSNRVLINYNQAKKRVTVDRGDYDGLRRTFWNPDKELQWVIFIDASSIELFCGEGEVTFSSRFFPKGDIFVQTGSDINYFHVEAIKRTLPLPTCT